jgi:hypothetical protein
MATARCMDTRRGAANHSGFALIALLLLSSSVAAVELSGTGDFRDSDDEPEGDINWDTQQDMLDQHKIQGGLSAVKALSKSLADRHFDTHGAKWPTRAFVDAVHEATLLARPQALPRATSAAELRLQRPMHDASRAGEQRMVVLMAMANDVALRQTVPTFIKSLSSVGLADQPGRSMADHIVLACSSETAVGLCKDLGVGRR